jgi:hypothetical protein
MPKLEARDVLVLLKILACADQPWTQPQIAAELFISQSMVSRALKTAAEAGLYHPRTRRVNAPALEEALVHGARFFLRPSQGGEVRGTATAGAAPPLSQLMTSEAILPPVWPDPDGKVRGLAVEPLHPNVPRAARKDPLLYELLALVDALRIGGPRERALAAKELHRRIQTP